MGVAFKRLWLLAALVILLLFLLVSLENWRQGKSGKHPVLDDLGLSVRETRLADRLRDMESRNRVLRHQLSLSESKWVKFSSLKKSNGGTEAAYRQVDDDDDHVSTNTGSACMVCENYTVQDKISI